MEVITSTGATQLAKIDEIVKDEEDLEEIVVEEDEVIHENETETRF